MQGYDPLGLNPLGGVGDTYVPPPPPYFDWPRTVISQYANSPVILELLGNARSCIDPAAILDDFYKVVWNIPTASSYGLNLWGRIVGVSRVLQIPINNENFGFEEAGDAEPFNNAPFHAGETITENYALPDTAYRTLIYAKALANITDGSVKAANLILRTLFPNRGNCYMRDNNDMTITWVFEFALTPVENSIVRSSGVLPKPVGVLATVEAL